MKRVAFVFPGQGSQEVGMGKALYETYDEVKDLFEQADEELEVPLTKLMFDGPQDELTKTEHAQPALLINSAAIVSLLEKEGIEPVMTAGHSLGEYSALVASKALKPLEAAALVQKRGQLMDHGSCVRAGSGCNPERFGRYEGR